MVSLTDSSFYSMCPGSGSGSWVSPPLVMVGLPWRLRWCVLCVVSGRGWVLVGVLEAAELGVDVFELPALLVGLLGQGRDAGLESLVAGQRGGKAYL
jgi:hypothetical protein